MSFISISELMIFVFIIVFICFGIKIYTISQSEIIMIRDIEMIVTNKKHYRVRKGKRRGYEDKYEVEFSCRNNINKKYYIRNRNAFYRYTENQNIIMQEVIYKNKDNYFSTIKFATQSDYNKLKSFNEKNPNYFINIDFNYMEKSINDYYYNKSENEKLLRLITLIPITIIGLFIAYYIYLL